MAMVKECGKGSLNPINIYRYIKFMYNFRREHPNYFDADGLLMFVGAQGTGKTLSAVNYVYSLLEMYPMSKICTNLLLTDYPVVTFEEYQDNKKWLVDLLKMYKFDDKYIAKFLWDWYIKENRVYPFNDNDDFIRYGNGEYGVIFLVDEIQLYLNSLESRNINMDVVTQISQQRKQRKHIVCTSQVFGRMAKPLREQFSNVVACKKYMGCIQKNQLIDRDSIESDNSADTQITGKVKKSFWWIHNPYEMYRRYDTYYVIEKGKFVSGEKQKEGVYNANDVRLSVNSK